MPLIKGAIAHQGTAFIDVVSPCVAFNNHAGSTKSCDYVREHNESVKPPRGGTDALALAQSATILSGARSKIARGTRKPLS